MEGALKSSELASELRDSLEWGTVVEIIGGPLKGCVGYYDDDNDTETRAVVYLDHPINVGEYHLIPYKHLRVAHPVLRAAWFERFDKSESPTPVQG